jgi:hypothetical protein
VISIYLMKLKGGSASPEDDGKGIAEGAILGGNAATLAATG